MTPLCEGSEVVKFVETESRTVVTRGWGGRGDGNVPFSGHRASAWGDEEVLGVDGGRGRRTIPLPSASNGERPASTSLQF